MSKTLTREPSIHPTVALINSKLGIYTEVGEKNVFENTEFGDYSYSGDLCIFQNSFIGKFANIATFVRLGPVSHPMERATLHHFTYRSSMYGFGEDDEDFFTWRKEQKVTLGHDVWLGHGVVVMPGVTIGHGAVVAAGAVVTKDVAPYTVVAGVPARYLRPRFDPKTGEDLQTLAWWDWDHETLKLRWKDFRLPVAEFIEKYRGAL